MYRATVSAFLIATSVAACALDRPTTTEPPDVEFLEVGEPEQVSLRLRVLQVVEGQGYEMAFKDGLAFQAHPEGFRIFDITKHTAEVIADVPMTGAGQTVSVADNYAFVSNIAGIVAFDISDPVHAIAAQFFPLTCGSESHVLLDDPETGTAVLFSTPASDASSCDQYYGVVEMDLNDIASATVQEPSLPATTRCGAFSAHAGEHTVTALCGGTAPNIAEHWDVTDPFNPSVLGSAVAPAGRYYRRSGRTTDTFLALISDDTNKLYAHTAADLSAPPLGEFQIPVRGSGPQTGCEVEFVPGTNDPYVATAGCGEHGTSVLEIRVVNGAAQFTEIAYYSSPDVSAWASYIVGRHVFQSGVPGLSELAITGRLFTRKLRPSNPNVIW